MLCAYIYICIYIYIYIATAKCRCLEKDGLLKCNAWKRAPGEEQNAWTQSSRICPLILFAMRPIMRPPFRKPPIWILPTFCSYHTPLFRGKRLHARNRHLRSRCRFRRRVPTDCQWHFPTEVHFSVVCSKGVSLVQRIFAGIVQWQFQWHFPMDVHNAHVCEFRWAMICPDPLPASRRHRLNGYLA